jgi:predicted nucleic acid-binding protein
MVLYETGKSTILVTGDKLLIKETAQKHMQVINWQEFMQLLGN